MLSSDATLKHDAATVDHLYSRLHPERELVRRGYKRLARLAELSTVTPLGAPVYKGSGQQPIAAVMNPPSDYGWFDDTGERRPRDWDEYCKYFRREVKPRPHRERVTAPRRQGLATIGELTGGKF